MIHDFHTAGALSAPADATVVIGSGAAGLAVALTLADGGHAVVLLESGGDTDRVGPGAGAAEANADLNTAEQTGLPLDGLVNGRSRTIGGTTALWHGQCMRLHAIDLGVRPWVPDSGWPIGLPDLELHYGDAERFLDVSGRGYGAARWEDHRSLAPLAWNPERLLHDFTEYTPRPHLGQVLRQRLAAHRSLQLWLHATVSRVVVSRNKVQGVELVADGRPPSVLPARRVVLAGGGIENPRLLMLSDPAGIGLGDGRRHTGRYHQDHPIIRTAQVQSTDFRVLQDRYIALHHKGRRLFPKVRLSPQAQQQHGLLDATAVFVHDHDDPAREALRRMIVATRHGRRLEHPWRDALQSMQAPAAVLRDTYRRYVKGLATGTPPTAVWLQLWLEQQPDAESRITLSDELDRFGLRQARVNWKCSDLEIRTSRMLTRWVAQDLERLGIATVRELPPMHDDAAWRRAVGDAAHPAGGTRMSADARSGVVDAQLKVHGVGGLYVAGSSVFPTAGYANPTLTIVALALRLAKQLLVSDETTATARHSGLPL